MTTSKIQMKRFWGRRLNTKNIFSHVHNIVQMQPFPTTPIQPMYSQGLFRSTPNCMQVLYKYQTRSRVETGSHGWGHKRILCIPVLRHTVQRCRDRKNTHKHRTTEQPRTQDTSFHRTRLLLCKPLVLGGLKSAALDRMRFAVNRHFCRQGTKPAPC